MLRRDRRGHARARPQRLGAGTARLPGHVGGPLAFAVMITVSLAPRHDRSAGAGQVMLRMHLPDALLQRAR
jgi:hypothetical protein